MTTIIPVNKTGLRSLVPATDLMIASLMGKVSERDGYFLIQSPGEPSFYYGNYLIFKTDQIPSDFTAPIQQFETEFPDSGLVKHRLFIFDGVEKDPLVPESAKALGFECDPTLGMTMTTGPSQFAINPDLEVREVNIEKEMGALIENGVANTSHGWTPEGLRKNLESRFPKYARIIGAGHGAWFGAYLQGRLITDFGLIHDGETGRFQSVGTHPEFHKRGGCRTLLKYACEKALGEWKLKKLVMASDPNDYPTKIYESAGFIPTQYSHAFLKRPPK